MSVTDVCGFFPSVLSSTARREAAVGGFVNTRRRDDDVAIWSGPVVVFSGSSAGRREF